MAACLITGATGFVGSHLAEACVGRGTAVQALVRPGSDASALEKLGVRIIRGQATDATALRDAVDGVDTVFHCAAKVGDWGPVDDYRAVNVEGTRVLLDACRAASTRRFVHLSSLGVYAARHHYATDETEPLPEVHIDGYTQSKVEFHLRAA
jgi:nucleoside-diphosphate-sugar epimerase